MNETEYRKSYIKLLNSIISNGLDRLSDLNELALAEDPNAKNYIVRFLNIPDAKVPDKPTWQSSIDCPWQDSGC